MSGNLSLGVFGESGVTVTVAWSTVTFLSGTPSPVNVTSDQPKTPSDKLPDNPGKSYPSGVAKDDLVKTVTRKVVIMYHKQI